MRELCFCVETDRSLGLPEVAARVLARLSTDVGGPPDRYGRVEPLREHFDPAVTDAFVEAWCDSTPGRTLNSLHFRRRSTYD